MKRKTCWILVLAAVLGGSPAPSDDSDLFIASRVAPNVVIVFDTSSSMEDRVGSRRKIDIARDVVSDLIEAVDGVRFGVMGFRRNGASMLAPIGTAKATIVSTVDNIRTTSVGTPLGDSLYDAGRYLAGNYPGHASPIQYACQANIVVLMTDGLPNEDSRNPVSGVSTSLHAADHSSLSGLQNAVVHTIGFNIDEGAVLLQATADNGGGEFYRTNDEEELQAAFQATLAQIVQQTVAFTAPLIPSTSVSGGSKAYMAVFEPNSTSPAWRGLLRAYNRDSRGRVPLGNDGKPAGSALAWEAGQLLAARSPDDRTIYTSVSGNRQSLTVANSAVTQGLLGVTGSSDRSKVINYTRGFDAYDADYDGDTTEQRSWKLGDIYHSNPVLVFPPPPISTESSFVAFRQANLSRPTIVLAGANDGMLHAFRQSDGHELWAYVPPDQLPRLKDMGARLGSHMFSIDGSPVVADIEIDGDWRTVVVFGERMGGRSYHALDITDTADPEVLWSFTDARLGETWSEPAVGKVRLNGGVEAYVAFVGGGYDSANNNNTGKVVLAIDLATGQKLWEYYNNGSADARYMNFSLAANLVVADLDNDGFLDRIYAGDVGGQLWKFDVSPIGTLTGGLVNNWTGKRLFVANTTQANPPPGGEYFPSQALYSPPALALDDFGDLWAFVGSGDRNNPNRSSVNRFYGIKDDTDMSNGGALNESSLADVTSVDATSAQGWFFRLGSDEKVLANADVFHHTVFFTTYTPNSVVTCENQGGVSRLYAVDMLTGYADIDWPSDSPLDDSDASQPRSETIGAGIPSDPTVIVDDTGASVVVGTTEGELPETPIPSERVKRVRFWREVM